MLPWRLCGEHCSSTAKLAFRSHGLHITAGQIQGAWVSAAGKFPRSFSGAAR
jgi:hypothetical protein